MIEHYSNTSTSTFRRCTYRFHQLYMLRDKNGPSNDSPSRGSLLGRAGHLALKAWYSGQHYKIAEDWAYQDFQPGTEEELKEFNHLRSALTYYWSSTLQDRWKVLEVEKEVRVGSYMGIFDLIVQTPTGTRMIVDHKFQKSRSVSHLDTTPQVSFYLMLARELGIEVNGLLYNIIPMSGDKVGHPIRKMCTRTPAFLDNFKKDLDTQIGVMQEFQLNPRPFRNFTEDCKWDCGIRDYCISQMEQ